MKSIYRFALLIICALAFAEPATAHPAPFSYMDVRLRQEAIELSLMVHIFDVAHDLGIQPMEQLLDIRVVTERAGAIRALLGPRLELWVDGVRLEPEWLQPAPFPDRQAVQLNLRYPLARPAGHIAIRTVMFPYDPVHQTFINVYEGEDLASQMILDRGHADTEYFAGTRQGVGAVIRRFVPSGIHHILIGPDHILFLIGLLLLGGTIRRLLLVVTAFTLAHSITLSLAALNILNPPASVIEPAIALSIVYVGADNLLNQGGRDVRTWIALVFGLIHGFGFANVLREMGLPPRALGWSLFSFNVGVEIGQLMVVVVVAFVLAAIRSRSKRIAHQLEFCGSILVIAAGTYWFVQRVFLTGV